MEQCFRFYELWRANTRCQKHRERFAVRIGNRPVRVFPWTLLRFLAVARMFFVPERIVAFESRIGEIGTFHTTAPRAQSSAAPIKTMAGQTVETLKGGMTLFQSAEVRHV